MIETYPLSVKQTTKEKLTIKKEINSVLEHSFWSIVFKNINNHVYIPISSFFLDILNSLNSTQLHSCGDAVV